MAKRILKHYLIELKIVKKGLLLSMRKNVLIDLIKKRSIVYSKAMYKINCENLSKNEIVKNVIKIYEAY